MDATRSRYEARPGDHPQTAQHRIVLDLPGGGVEEGMWSFTDHPCTMVMQDGPPLVAFSDNYEGTPGLAHAIPLRMIPDITWRREQEKVDLEGRPMKLVYHVVKKAEGGLVGIADVVTISCDNSFGETEELIEHWRKAVKTWYDASEVLTDAEMQLQAERFELELADKEIDDEDLREEETFRLIREDADRAQPGESEEGP